jgi:hypothetical protein
MTNKGYTPVNLVKKTSLDSKHKEHTKLAKEMWHGLDQLGMVVHSKGKIGKYLDKVSAA